MSAPPPNPVADRPEPSEVAKQRRIAVVEAAIDIISTQGIHKLSLGNIEKRVKMKRGHLTYYFPTKEAILLAVLDRMIERMIDQAMAMDGPKPGTGQMWYVLEKAFAHHLQPPDANRWAFLSLIHTFHAQAAFRDDVRTKLAETNAGWRQMLAADYAASVPDPKVPPPVAATIVMALLQGLGGQLAVDPNAFDRDRVRAAVLQLLAPLFGLPSELSS
jgi:AcrR family transcriptional regulator